MDLSSLSAQAVSIIAGFMGGVAQNMAAQALTNVVVDRLQGSASGAQAYLRLQRDPENSQRQQEAIAAIVAEAEADDAFAAALREAVAAALADSGGTNRSAAGITTGGLTIDGNVQDSNLISGNRNRINQSRRNYKFGIGGMILLAFIGGGVGLYQTLETKSADQESSQQGNTQEGEGKAGRGSQPKASTLDEAASQVRKALGHCDGLTKGSVDKHHLAQGLTSNAVCSTDFGYARITMIDVVRRETRLKNNDFSAAGWHYYGQGFYLELEASNSGTDQTKNFKNALLSAGYLYLDCSKEFSPYSGVKVIKAQTTGCRYTDVY